jgi:hypothetical protein
MTYGNMIDGLHHQATDDLSTALDSGELDSFVLFDLVRSFYWVQNDKNEEEDAGLLEALKIVIKYYSTQKTYSKFLEEIVDNES